MTSCPDAERRSPALDFAAVSCDVDGVLFRSGRVIPGARHFLAELARRRIPLALLTNHAEASPTVLARRVSDLGYPLPPSRVVTSAMLVAAHARASGVSSAFVLGGARLVAALRVAGIRRVLADEPADAVVVGYLRRGDATSLAEGARRLRAGARFYAANADVVVPTEAGFDLETGAWIALLRAAGAAPPTVVGKPSAGAFAAALAQLGAPVERTLMIGDTLETDILGAKAMSMPTCRVRSGNAPSDAAADAAADLAFDDVGALAAAWFGPRPSSVISSP